MRPKLPALFGAVIAACLAAPGQAQTPKSDHAALAATGILERLAERSGVYGVPPTAKTPGFIADAGWPQKLPNNWIIGQVGGLYVAPDDHIWIFRTPVHCVKIARDGLLYVCDRGNNRVQVFNGRDPNLGQECRNPSGEIGKCGFVKEQFVSVHTNGLPGSAVSMNFSTDAGQSCLYVGDNSNMTIYVLKRDTLEELGRLGRSGREAGEFHWLHQVSLDSRGNIYTAEVDTGKRLQKFVRYGGEGCSGTGRTTVGGVLR